MERAEAILWTVFAAQTLFAARLGLCQPPAEAPSILDLPRPPIAEGPSIQPPMFVPPPRPTQVPMTQELTLPPPRKPIPPEPYFEILLSRDPEAFEESADPNHYPLLVYRKDVRSEIDLEGRQWTTVRTVLREHQRRLLELRDREDYEREWRRSKSWRHSTRTWSDVWKGLKSDEKAASRAAADELKPLLTEDQIARLQEIAVQQCGYHALLQEDIAGVVGLTEDQQRQIQSRLEDFQRKLDPLLSTPDSDEQVDRLIEESALRVGEILTGEQMKRYREMEAARTHGEAATGFAHDGPDLAPFSSRYLRPGEGRR